MAVSLRQKGWINYAVMYRTSKAEGGAASVSFLERPANIRIIRIIQIFEYILLMPVSLYPNMSQTDIVSKSELSNHPYLSKIHQHLLEI